MGLRIIKLMAENIKILKAVAVTPEGDVVKITGPNGAGKTSVLDCIWWGLGGERVIPAEPIRRGQKRARIELHLGAEVPEIIVERKFSAKTGTSLTVKSADGTKFSSPQKVLDKLVGALTFDPLVFMEMNGAKQLDTLKELVGIDLSDLDEQRRGLYEDRTAASRDLKRLDARLEGIMVPADAPEEEVSLKGLLSDIEKGNAINAENAAQRRGLEVQEARIGESHKTICKLLDEQKELAKRIEGMQQAQNEAIEAIAATEKEVEALEDVNIQELQDSVLEVQDRNTAARQREEWRELDVERDVVAAKVRICKEGIEDVDAEKAKRLEAAKFPIEGLSFGDDTVIYNELPLGQASSAEQLRVSIAMGMALNPQLQLMRCHNASLLDPANLEILEKMAGENDFQLWLEMVDTSKKVGISIEEGEVVAINGKPVEDEDGPA